MEIVFVKVEIFRFIRQKVEFQKRLEVSNDLK